MLLSIVIVLVLVVLNGFFAMSELAIVSARRSRLETMAKAGSRGAARALKLAEDPTGFLSTVQVGITLIGIFAGAYSGATLAEPLADALRAHPGRRLDRRHARLRARGRRHHLRLAHHRRAGAEAPRAPQRRGHRRLRLRPPDAPRRRRQARRLVPARLDRGGARASCACTARRRAP